MKLPRFHLSTLLLACVFAGALIGLWLAPPVWQRHFVIALPSTNATHKDRLVGAVAFNRKGTFLFAQEIYQRRCLIELQTQKIIWDVPNDTGIFAMFARFVEDDATIQAVNQRVDEDFESVDCYSTLTGEHIMTFRTPVGSLFETDGLLPKVSFQSENARPDIETRTRILFDIGRVESPDYELNVGHSFAGLAYSLDGRYLATGWDGGVTIWRRTRGYGWKGYFELPLFWIAVVSFLCLLAISIRRLARSIRKRA